jgi:two-component system, sensor histidine kinase and response regulator
MSDPATILIVDDLPSNIGVLYHALANAGYRLRIADNGTSALQSIEAQLPDLVLLDVMMPDLDGFEVCSRLKSNPDTLDIPVIFMTALTGTAEQMRGFAVGGVDYVTKPIHVETTLARVRTHLMLRQAQLQLQRQNAELDAYAHTVAHDLKNPLTGVVTTAALLQHFEGRMSEDEQRNYIGIIHKAAQRCVNTVDELLVLARQRQIGNSLVQLSMQAPVEQALAQLQTQISAAQALIVQPETWPEVRGNQTLLSEIWLNYISNALKYGGTPPHVELGYDASVPGAQRFWVRDNGPGLSETARKSLFQQFVRLQPAKAEGTGLGLAIVRNMVHKLGGEVGIESQPGLGSTFFFTLPLPH